jgi:hypothetical protein
MGRRNGAARAVCPRLYGRSDPVELEFVASMDRARGKPWCCRSRRSGGWTPSLQQGLCASWSSKAFVKGRVMIPGRSPIRPARQQRGHRPSGLGERTSKLRSTSTGRIWRTSRSNQFGRCLDQALPQGPWLPRPANSAVRPSCQDTADGRCSPLLPIHRARNGHGDCFRSP